MDHFLTLKLRLKRAVGRAQCERVCDYTSAVLLVTVDPYPIARYTRIIYTATHLVRKTVEVMPYASRVT